MVQDGKDLKITHHGISLGHRRESGAGPHTNPSGIDSPNPGSSQATDGAGTTKSEFTLSSLPLSKTRFFIIFFSWNQPKRGQWGPKQPGSGWGQPPQRPDQNIWPPQPSWVRSYFFNSIAILFRMPLADIPTRIQVSIIISIKICNM